MSHMTPWQLELLKSFFMLLLLLISWGIGQRILVFWDGRKKRQELDIAAAERFHHLYGELKQVGRLWRSAKKPKGDAPTSPPNLQWELFARAVAAESAFEALVIKLSTERVLSLQDIQSLGLFRQAVQVIRDSIGRGETVPASGFGPDYRAFNDVAADVACLIGANGQHTAADSQTSRRRLKEIARVQSNHWSDFVTSYAE